MIVVVDIGKVLLRWNLRNLFRKAFGDEKRMERFLTTARRGIQRLAERLGGRVELPMNPAEARPFLTRALDLFKESEHDIGAYLAWAGATEAILHDFSARQATLDESITRMRELNRRFPRSPRLTPPPEAQ